MNAAQQNKPAQNADNTSAHTRTQDTRQGTDTQSTPDNPDADLEEVDGSDRPTLGKTTDKMMKKTAAEQLAVIEAMEKTAGIHQANEAKLKKNIQPIMEKIETMGEKGIALLHRYHAMTKDDKTLPGPKYWLANILDMDASSPEFLSFHKLFRDFNWAPSHECFKKVWGIISSGEIIGDGNDLQSQIDTAMKEVTMREIQGFIESMEPNSSLIQIEDTENIKEYGEVETNNEKYGDEMGQYA
jgi:hypothetical protein